MPLRMGPMEIVLLLVVVVIIFGVGRLPEVGAGVGKGIREFRRALTNSGESVDNDGGDRPDLSERPSGEVAPSNGRATMRRAASRSRR